MPARAGKTGYVVPVRGADPAVQALLAFGTDHLHFIPILRKLLPPLADDMNCVGGRGG